MARYLSDNCYCNGSLTANSITTSELKATKAIIPTVEIEHVQTDVVQSDYVYGTEEVGGGHVDALHSLSLANESVEHWQDLIDNEYINVPTPAPDIDYDNSPSFNKLTEVNQYTVLDVASSAEDVNTMLALMTKDGGYTSVLFESTNGGSSWSYLFATPHFMTNLSPYYNASNPNTFGCFGQGYVYNYVLRDTHYEMTIAPIDYKNCLKTFPVITASGNSYIISYYNTTGTVCSSWNSLSAHAGCSGCVAGCQVRDKIYNIKNNGTIIIFDITNCVNNSNYTEITTALSSSYNWTDICYNSATDTIVCVSSNNKIALFRHEITALSTAQTFDYTTSSASVYLEQCLPWYGTCLLVTNMNSDWKVLVDDDPNKLNQSITFNAIADDKVPGLLFTYHYHPYTNTYTSIITGKAYTITQTNKTSATVMQALVNILYPIGSIYTSSSATSPERFIGGKWTLLSNRFIYATTDIKTLNDVGGEETHQLIPAEMPVHYHDANNPTGANQICFVVNPSYSGVYETTCPSGVYTASRLNAGSLSTKTAGGDQPHNNMPPYIKCFVWRRYA